MEKSWKRQRTSRYQDVSSQRSKDGDNIEQVRAVAKQMMPPSTEPLLIRERKGRPVMGPQHRILHRRQLSLTTVEATLELSSTVIVSVGIDAGGSTTELTTFPPESITPSSDASVTAAGVPATSASASPTPETTTPEPQPSSYAPSSGSTASAPAATPTPVPEPTPSTSPISPISPTSTPIPVPSIDTNTTLSTSLSTSAIPSAVSPSVSSTVPAPSGSSASVIPGIARTANSTVPVLSTSLTSSIYSTVSLGPLSSNQTSTTTSLSSSLSTKSSALLKPRPSSSSILSSLTSGTTKSSSSETTETTSTTTAASTESSKNGAGMIGTAAGTGAGGKPTGAGGSVEDNGSSGPPPTGVVVGGVVGGVAGLAALLLLALILLRWYKGRGSGVQRLEENTSTSDVRQIGPPDRSMSERSFLPAAAVGWLSRFKEKDYESGTASSSAPTREGSFQKISGRKLPSAFSPGLSAEDVAAIRQGHGSALSASTYSRDSQGRVVPSWYGGAGGGAIEPLTLGESSRGEHGVQAEKETLMPSPARTPVIHSPGPHAIDFAGAGPGALHRPLTPVRGTLGRRASDEASKGSRFTEEV